MFTTARQLILRQLTSHIRTSKSICLAHQGITARLLSTLTVLEQREGKLQNSSLGAVTAAQKLGGSVTAFVAGSGVKSVAEEAAKVKGLDKVIMVENASYDKVYVSLLYSLSPTLINWQRDFRKTMHPCLSRTSRKVILHMLSQAIQHLARISCQG